MERLSVRDQRAVQRLLRAIYGLNMSSSSTDSWIELAARELGKVIPNTFITYREGIRSNARTLPHLVPSHLDTAVTRARWATVADKHPLIEHFVSTRSDGTRRLSDLLSSRLLHRLPIYQDFYRIIGVEDVLACQFTTRDSLDIGIGFHRDGRFSDRDRCVLEAVRPHLVAAYDNASALAVLRKQLQVFERALERAGYGVITLNSNRRIAFATEQALTLLQDYFEHRESAASLPDTLDLWVRHHDAQLQRTLDIPPIRRPLMIGRPGKELVVRMLSNDGESALLLQERHTIIEPASLVSLGLTRRETEVLSQVAQGKTNKEAAENLSIGDRTVQTHLERVFSKIGVRTRAAAVAKALRSQSIPTHSYPRLG